jgi:hypothetical protein
MRIPRSKGAVSGLVLMVLGAWGALIPLVGPYFNWVIGTDDAWDWTAGRWWLSILPGVVTVIGGAMLFAAARRREAAIGTWLAAAGGTWFVVGPTVSRLWNDGVSQTGTPYGGTTRQVLEQLTYFSALGAAILGISLFALGRMAAWTPRDADLEGGRAYGPDRDETAYDEREPDDGAPLAADDSSRYRRGLGRRRRGAVGDRTTGTDRTT